MAEKSAPKIWGLATESEIDSVFREAGIALTCQDAATVNAAASDPLVSSCQGLLGRTDEAFCNGADRSLAVARRRVAESGEGETVELSHSGDGAERWYRITIEPVDPGDGAGRGVLSAAVDVTAQKTAEEHLRLALLELAHRSKNLLAVVLSLARQSADDSRSLEDFRGRFIGRIRALALAHDILTEEAWRGATVFSLVHGQLAAFGEDAGERSRVEGHNAFLKPNAVQYVGLALHELIAHSMLSGSLAEGRGGRVQVTSEVETDEDGEQTLCLTWSELGGGSEALDSTSEFGEALLRTIVPTALGGTATLDRPGGGRLAYSLRIPASQFF